MKIRHLLLSATTALSCFAPALHATAATYPERPVRIIVGFAPGGGVDLTARILAPELEKELGQPIVVENRAGAGGSIGNAAASRAQPDGYTLLLGNTGAFAITPSLLDEQSYDILEDFTPIASVSQTPLMFLVRDDSPLQSFEDLVTATQDPTQQISYGTGGTGSISHLIAENLKHELKMQMEHIAYRGGGQTMTDLLGGQIQMGMDGVAVASAFINAGKVRALAATSEQRIPVLDHVPTLAESGYAGHVYQSWYGLLAPTGTDPEIIARLNEAVNKVLAQPSFQRKLLEQQGAETIPGTSEDFGILLQREVARWNSVIQLPGIKEPH